MSEQLVAITDPIADVILTKPVIDYPPQDVDHTAWINPVSFQDVYDADLAIVFDSTQSCVDTVQSLISNVAVATKEIESSTVEITRSLSWLDENSRFKGLTFANKNGQHVTFKSVSNWLDKQAADGVLGRSKAVVLGTWSAYKNINKYYGNPNAVLNILDRAGLVNFRALGGSSDLLDYVRWCGMKAAACKEAGRDNEGQSALFTLINQAGQLSTKDFGAKLKVYRDGLSGKKLALKTELRSDDLKGFVSILHDCDNSKDEKVRKIGDRIRSLIYTTSK